MSEYQYYRFECLDSHLSSSQRQALRQISSRADISITSFQVSYHYGDLKADPQQMMLDNFDIGVYFASWGSQEAYIKLPQGTLPAELLQFSAYGFSVYDTEQWLLLVFSNEENERYLDDEDAEELLRHLANLRGELLQGDWRLVYFIWLRAFDIDAEPDAIPLINFDFQQLSPAQRAFVDLFDVPLAVVKALALTLANAPSHSVNPAQLQLDKWLEQLTEIEKDQLLQVVFTQGQLTKHAAVAMTRKPAESEHYQYWLDSAIITPYIDTAATQLAQQQAAELAQQLAKETAAKAAKLTIVYQQREQLWQQAQSEAARACASAYDQVAADLHQLAEAYQLNNNELTFQRRFQRFIAANNGRKALLTRLADLME